MCIIQFGCSKEQSQSQALVNGEKSFQVREMTISDTSEGWGGDLRLSISKISSNDTLNIINAESIYKGKNIGFTVKVPSKSKSQFSQSVIIIESNGLSSDNFVNELARAYKLEKTDFKLKKRLEIAAVSMGNEGSNHMYKIFFEGLNGSAEAFINIDTETGILEFKEKDSEYRKSILANIAE